jgi:putrescine transport system permease protein
MNNIQRFSDQLREQTFRKWQEHFNHHPQYLAIIIPYIWLFVFFFVPFLIILKISFSQAIFALPPFEVLYQWCDDSLLQIKLNFGNFTVLLKDPFYREAFGSSLKIAGTATVNCLILGYMMAYGITNASPHWRILLILLVLLPFWTSFLIRVYAWMSLLSAKGVINTVLIKLGLIQDSLLLLDNAYAAGLGITYCYLPFMVLPIYSSLEKIDPVYWEAAYDLGASPWRTFWRITVPLSKPGIFAGCILVFIPAIGEFVVPELLGGPDTIMIGRVLWSEFFNNQDWPRACALAVFMMTIFVVPIMAFQRYQQRNLHLSEQ